MMRILLVVLIANGAALAANPVKDAVPLFFIANHGQAPPAVRFMAKGSGLTAYFSPGEALFRVAGRSVRMRFEKANPSPRIEGMERLPGHANFLIGAQRDWRSDVPLYGAVVYRGLYPGIDMVYGGDGRDLKSEFAVAPGADPSRIRVRYAGAGGVRIEENGALTIPVDGVELREQAPSIYQERRGKRVAVEGRFAVDGDGAVRFVVGDYDVTRPLIIDPVLLYSTLLGGSGSNAATALAVDSAGAAYVAGFTDSYNLPAANPEQNFNAGGNDAFVAKLNPSGNGLVYCTYVGGSADDRAYGIAVDETGSAYVTGMTTSANFPVRNALQSHLAGGRNAFVLKLNPAGNTLVYSTYLGGNASDNGNGIAVDGGGDAYVVGDTTSINFPATGMQRGNHGGQDAFVAKLSADGSRLLYSTYLGGGSADRGAGIAVDASGSAYIIGSTYSTDFPVANAFQSHNAGGQDAFIARLSADGNSLLFSTYLGGTGGTAAYPEAGQGIALDSQGSAYVTGVTSSANFPLLDAVQSSLRGSLDAFVAKVNASGTLAYSTYLGGSSVGMGNAIAVDSGGSAYVVGYSYSTDLPVTANALQTANAGDCDAFVAKLNATGNSLVYLSYLGGNSSDTATAVALDPSVNVYVAGWTLSTNFPLLNPYQSATAANYGAFVTKMILPSPVLSIASSHTGNFTQGQAGATYTVTVTNQSGASATSGVVTVTETVPTGMTLVSMAGTGWTCPAGGTTCTRSDALNPGMSYPSITVTVNVAVNAAAQVTNQVNVSGGGAAGASANDPTAITTASPVVPVVVSFSPGSGTGSSQAFTAVYSSTLGAGDILSTQVIVSASWAWANSCFFGYDSASGKFLLVNDAGTAWLAGGAPPGSGSVGNSQCTILGAGSSVTISGNLFTVVYNIQFRPAFAGTKTIWTNAYSKSSDLGSAFESNVGGVNLSWTVTGAAPVMPTVVSFSPASGSGSSQAFTAVYSSTLGGGDILSTQVIVSASWAWANSCFFGYDTASSKFLLVNDAGTAWLAGSAPPGSGSVANSQCTILGAGSSVTISGNLFTVVYNIQFRPAFTGTKTIWTNAYSKSSDLGSAYESNVGGVNLSWTVTGAAPVVPTVVSFSPASGSGSSQAFTAVYSSTLGGGDILSTQVIVSASWAWANSCFFGYDTASSKFLLVNDAGTAWLAGGAPPGSGSVGNSQCTLLGAGSSVTISGNLFTVVYNIQFKPAFAGTKTIWTNAYSKSSDLGSAYESNVGGVNLSWTVTGAAPVVPTVVSFSPASGSGSSQAFTAVYSSTLGGGDILSTQVIVSASWAWANSCFFGYDTASSKFLLVNDAGTAWLAGGAPPGSGSVGNSQCTLLGAGSSVTISGNLFTVVYNIQFRPAFAGTKTIWTNAYSKSSDLGSAFESNVGGVNLSWSVN
jgi:uncharacterized repeat protein (TIGR01451 family)